MKQKKEIILLIILTSILCVAIYHCPTPITTLSYYGSSGGEVSRIQSRLADWGYYDGWIDGVYGYKTFLAVKRFQANNGLRVDGVVGSETLTAIGLPTGTYTPSSSGGGSAARNVNLMAHAIYGEARGESFVGKVAVGAVILNRTQDARFPGTIAGVIYQPGAFTAVSDGQINLDPDQESIRAAHDALNGWDPTGGCVYYFNPATSTSPWIWNRPVVTVIGRHYFAR